jgi:pyruvate dehydrogenase E2 component (dihydrolipoamide acetyltransferase)
MSSSTRTTASGTVDFTMPSLGADMDEGRITEWLVRPGDHVRRGQIVVVVETEKSDIEVEVFEPGTVAELLVAEGETVAVGTPIARIEVVGSASAPPPPPPAPVAAPASGPAHAAAPGSHVTSPVIRHLADQLHVDAAHLRGSGPGGRIHRDDVERAARRPARARVTPRARRLLAEHGLEVPTAFDRSVLTGDDVLRRVADGTPATPVPVVPPPGTVPSGDRAASMRRHIAELMTRSWREIPHYHVATRLDLTTLTSELTERNAARPLPDRIVPGAALLWATARAAAAVPACNGWWRGDRFEPAGAVTLGVVLSLRTGGVVVPTIDRADELDLDAVMARLGELVQRARQGRLRASDMTEASITVTNLGDLGARSVSGVIHPPQVALVGFGAVHDDVWAVDGRAVVRPTVEVTLAGDHRATDGLSGARLLAKLQVALDRPFPEDPT